MKPNFLLVSATVLISTASLSAQDRVFGAPVQAAPVWHDNGSGSGANHLAHCIKHRFNMCYGGTISGPSSVLGTSIEQAVPFTAGQTETVKSISVALRYVSGTNSATVNLYADDNGLPGAVLASGTAANIGEFTKVTKVSIPRTRIAYGTPYWIGISASGTTFMAWTASSQSGKYIIALDEDEGGWTTYDSSYTWWGHVN